MKTEINSHTASKINWTGMIMLLTGTASATGRIPAATEQHLTDAVLIGGGALVVVFRSLFTGPDSIQIPRRVALGLRAAALVAIVGAVLWMAVSA